MASHQVGEGDRLLAAENTSNWSIFYSGFFSFFIDLLRINLPPIDPRMILWRPMQMSNVLVIESSVRHEGSISRQLTAEFVEQWRQANPSDQITVRDLASEPVPHLDGDLLGGWMKPAAEQTVAERAAALRSNQLTDELLAADVLVLAAPMYNFAIPSTLKSWLDHVLRAGITFQYTAEGPRGLLQGKRAFVLTARGGVYAGGSFDQQEPYLRQALGFIGINEVTFIHAEGLNMGGDAAEQGLAKARAQLAEAV